MLFEEFSVDPRCLKILKQQDIHQPTPVQEQTIPIALEGRDVVASAQTGTGKTLAFALPALTCLVRQSGVNRCMLVLAPTRELARQVYSVMLPLAKILGLRSVCVHGGVGFQDQIIALRKNCNIIVATPGRLLDHIGRKNAHLRHVSILVIDEADRMLDMGFIPDVREILSHLPKERQTMMFSATFPPEIIRLAADMQREPVRIQIGAVSAPAESVQQGVYTVAQPAKVGLLIKILREKEVRSALVFLRTRHRTDYVAKALHKAGFKVQAIHGDRSQGQRQQALEGFRTGRYNVLVATDIAARGLDIEGVSHVINFDIPKTSDEYVHRIGRTGRASATGAAITFVCPDEFMALRTIERSLGRNLPREEWEGAVHVISLYQPPSERPAGGRRLNVRRGRSLLRRR